MDIREELTGAVKRVCNDNLRLGVQLHHEPLKQAAQYHERICLEDISEEPNNPIALERLAEKWERFRIQYSEAAVDAHNKGFGDAAYLSHSSAIYAALRFEIQQIEKNLKGEE